jgi:hypothetical protein
VRVQVKPALVEWLCTMSMVGNRQLGKISVTMNLMKRACSKVIGRPFSIISRACKIVMVCSSITPSSGSAL